MRSTALRIQAFSMVFNPNAHQVNGSTDGTLELSFKPFRYNGVVEGIDIELTKEDEKALLNVMLRRLGLKVQPGEAAYVKHKMDHSGRPLTSRYRGVHYDKKHGKWTARLSIDYKRHRATFDDEHMAAKQYNEWVTTFGLHRPLNVIEQ